MYEDVPSKSMSPEKKGNIEQKVIDSNLGNGIQNIGTGNSNQQVQGENNWIGNVEAKIVNEPIFNNSPGAVFTKNTSLISIKVLTGIVVFIALIALAIWYKSQQPYRMKSSFNIVVLEFGKTVDNEILPSKAGEVIRKPICDLVESEISKESSLLSGRVDSQCISISSVKGKDISEALQYISSRTDADLVIYGVLNTEQFPHEALPYFYIPEDYIDGGEITGSSFLGEPIEFALPMERDNKEELLSNLSPRIISLIHFVYGSFKFANGPDEALKHFTKSEEELSSDWKELQGREVSLLFKAASLSKLSHIHHNNHLQLGSQARFQKNNELYRKSIEQFKISKQRADEAEAIFKEVLDMTNHQYARAYIGLGTLNYGLSSLQDGAFNRNYIDTAIEYYHKALKATLKPSEAYIDVKSNFLIGIMLVIKETESINNNDLHSENVDSSVTTVCSNQSQEAIDRLNSVISEYHLDPNNLLLQNLAGRSHYNLGILYRFCGDLGVKYSHINTQELYEGAVDEFQESLQVLESKPSKSQGFLSNIFPLREEQLEREFSWQRYRWEVEIALASTYLKIARSGEEYYYDHAIECYEDFIERYEPNNYIPQYAIAESYYNLGIAFEDIGKPQKAAELYRKTLSFKSYLDAHPNRFRSPQDKVSLDENIDRATRRLQNLDDKGID